MKYDAFISYRRENGFLMAQVIRERLKLYDEEFTYLWERATSQSK